MFTVIQAKPKYRTTYTKGFEAHGNTLNRVSNKLSLVSVPTRTFIGMRTKTVHYKSEAHYLKTLEKKNRPASEPKVRTPKVQTPKAHAPKLALKDRPKPKGFGLTKGPVQVRPSIKAVDSRPDISFYELAYSRR
jgi:hypothetical protein